MAIQDNERQEIIDRINALPEEARKAAYDGFRLGHEEGWWLARTDPDSTTSPVTHAAETNPFNPEPAVKPCTCGARKTREACVCPHLNPDGHAVVSLAYVNTGGTWITKSKVIPLGDEKVSVEFKMQKGDTVHAFDVRLYAGKTDKYPAVAQTKNVPATIMGANETYSVEVVPKLTTLAA